MHKKKILFYLVFIISIISLIILSIIVYKDIKYKLDQQECEKSMYEFIENNSKDIFTIDRITFFSSANASSSINSNSSFNIQSLGQYTDIAIFINNHAERKLHT